MEQQIKIFFLKKLYELNFNYFNLFCIIKTIIDNYNIVSLNIIKLHCNGNINKIHYTFLIIFY